VPEVGTYHECPFASIDRDQREAATEAFAVATFATLVSAKLADVARLVRRPVECPSHDEVADR
jgi:hypothetical protein